MESTAYRAALFNWRFGFYKLFKILSKRLEESDPPLSLRLDGRAEWLRWRMIDDL